MIYERGEVLGVTYHENLFSVKLAWEAQFMPFVGRWFWKYPPKAAGVPAQIIDGNVTDTSPFSDPIGVIQISKTIWHGEITTQEMNPDGIPGRGKLITNSETNFNTIEGGSWIIPPKFQGLEFLTDQICNFDDTEK